MARGKSPGRKSKSKTKSIEPKKNDSRSASPASPRTPLNRLLVGGQLLGNRPTLAPDHTNIVSSWDTFEPIITPEITYEQRKKPERLILLPHARYITVLSYKTGIKIATLAPSLKDEDDKNVIIECVSLVNYQRKQSETTVQDVLDRMDVEDDDDDDEENTDLNGTTDAVDETLVMVGCSDGSVREFSLLELGNRGSSDKTVHFGAYKVSGPCFRPRRVIRVLKNEPIMDLTVPHLRTQVRDDGILVYVAARRLISQEEGSKEASKSVGFSIEVLRVLLPHFDGSTTDIDLSSKETMRSLDKIKCRISKGGNNKKFANTLPFRMLSAAKVLPTTTGDNTMQQNCSIFVVLARANIISVYYDQLNSSEVFTPLTFSMPSNNPLTAVDISLNNADITCGHYRGNIRVMNNILNDIELYQISMKESKQLNGGTSVSSSLIKTGNLPQDPRKNMITSRVHWHALPVTSMVYDSMSYPMDPLLYSGGDESVLVTWQISQGRDRPVDVHPRLALGGIVHLSSSDRCDANPANGIIVYCEDNTLQLLESHNKGCIWKVQGLACGGQNSSDNMPSLHIDPRSDGQKNSQVVVTGLDQAPGYIHWFDPKRERLASSLEVVPYNRISRTEPDECPLPKPTITGHAFSKNGEDLITIDESQTENVYIGAREEQAKGEEYGTVSTIRFWSWNDSSSAQGKSAPPYHQIASMTYPHGPKSRISAIGMSIDGTFACTVSYNEQSFRVWQRAGRDKSISWACRYKVKIPAGFSNCSTKKYGVTFSDENSLLAIAFGQVGTIWDTDGARLLTTFDHSQGNSDIERLQFISPGLHQDLLLIQSKACVSLRSPYGPYGSSGSFQGWCWSVPQSPKGSIITAVELVESHECIAIAMYSPIQNQSRVVLIDVTTGKGKSSMSLIEDIDGCISALCAVGKKRVKSNWDNDSALNGKATKSTLTFYALTSVGDLLLFTEGATETKFNGIITTIADASAGPRLDIAPSENNRRKRQRTQISSGALSKELAKTKKLALDIFGSDATKDSTGDRSTAELPSLSTNFVKTFVGRNLCKTR